MKKSKFLDAAAYCALVAGTVGGVGGGSYLGQNCVTLEGARECRTALVRKEAQDACKVIKKLGGFEPNVDLDGLVEDYVALNAEKIEKHAKENASFGKVLVGVAGGVVGGALGIPLGFMGASALGASASRARQKEDDAEEEIRSQ